MPYKDQDQRRKYDREYKAKTFNRQAEYSIRDRHIWFKKNYPEPDFSMLSDRESEILKYYFGVGIPKPLALDDIATLCDVSRAMVHKVKKRAWNKFLDKG